jgi:plastocyanin
VRKAITMLGVALAIVALAACGGDDEPTITSARWFDLDKPHPGRAEFGSPPLELEADPDGDLAYTTDEVTAIEGNVTIEFTNPQSTPHNVVMEASGGGRVETRTVSSGFDALVITLNTREEFTFYCKVPGHREAGMEGVVEVDPRGA